jgi:hypothetical protein
MRTITYWEYKGHKMTTKYCEIYQYPIGYANYCFTIDIDGEYEVSKNYNFKLDNIRQMEESVLMEYFDELQERANQLIWAHIKLCLDVRHQGGIINGKSS